MAYYKIPKEKFLAFTKEFQEKSLYTPSIILTKDEFSIILEQFTLDFTSQNIDQILNKYQEYNKIDILNLKSLLENIQTILSNPDETTDLPTIQSIIENNNINLSSFNFNAINTYDLFRLFTANYHYSKPINNLNNHNFIYNFQSMFLNNETKINYFSEICSMVIAKKQKHIIDVNFGNEHSIPLQPIKNVDGLLQNYALNYIDVDNVIIHSPSAKNIIIESLQLETPLIEVSEEEYSQLLKSDEYYLNFNDILNNQAYILESKADNQTETIKLSLIETLLEEFNTIQANSINSPRENNNLVISKYFEAIEEYLKSPSSKWHATISNLDKSVITLLHSQEAQKFFILKIKEQFNTIYQIEKEIISDPINKDNIDEVFINKTAIQRQIIQKIGKILHNTLQHDRQVILSSLKEDLSRVEIFHLFGSSHLSKNYINQSDDSVSIHEGWTLSENDSIRLKFSPFNGEYFSSFIKSLKANDENSFAELNSSRLFTFLHQEIYPALHLKQKLLPENYEKILNPHFNTNISLLHKTLPLALLMEDDIFERLKAKFQHYSFNKIFKETYFEDVGVHRLLNFIEKFNKTPQTIPENSFNFNNYKLSGVIAQLIISDNYKNNVDDYIKFIINYDDYLTKNNIQHSNYSQLLYSTPSFDLNLNKDDAFKFYKLISQYSSKMETMLEKTVDTIIKDPTFDINKDEYPLVIYKESNDCFSQNSLTSTIHYFRKQFKNIIAHHIENNTICTNDFLTTVSSSFYTKPILSEISKYDINILKVIPNLIKIIDLNKLDSYEQLLEIGKTLIVNSEVEINRELRSVNSSLETYFKSMPKELSNNNELFKKYFMDFLNITPNHQTNKNHGYIIKVFNPMFFNQEFAIIQGLNFLDKHSSNKDALNLLCSANSNYGKFFKAVADKKLNPQEVIAGIHNIQMTRSAFIQQDALSSNVGIKQFKF